MRTIAARHTFEGHYAETEAAFAGKIFRRWWPVAVTNGCIYVVAQTTSFYAETEAPTASPAKVDLMPIKARSMGLRGRSGEKAPRPKNPFAGKGDLIARSGEGVRPVRRDRSTLSPAKVDLMPDRRGARTSKAITPMRLLRRQRSIG